MKELYLIETVDLGQGIHYIREDHPKTIGKAMKNIQVYQKSGFSPS
jgi:hypothetical protein